MWVCELEMEDLNPSESGQNEGCIVVFAAEYDGDSRIQRKEFSAVGFVRRNSKNKRKKLSTVLREQTTLCKEVCEALNENGQEVDALLEARDELQRRWHESVRNYDNARLSNGEFVKEKLAEAASDVKEPL